MAQAPTEEAPVTQEKLTTEELTAKLSELATELQVPGVAAGIFIDGKFDVMSGRVCDAPVQRT